MLIKFTSFRLWKKENFLFYDFNSLLPQRWNKDEEEKEDNSGDEEVEEQEASAEVEIPENSESAVSFQS